MTVASPFETCDRTSWTRQPSATAQSRRYFPPTGVPPHWAYPEHPAAVEEGIANRGGTSPPTTPTSMPGDGRRGPALERSERRFTLSNGMGMYEGLGEQCILLESSEAVQSGQSRWRSVVREGVGNRPQTTACAMYRGLHYARPRVRQQKARPPRVFAGHRSDPGYPRCHESPGGHSEIG